MRKILGLVMVASLLHTNNGFAFGLGDLVNTGVTSGMKVGGALFSKMTEESPEEKERKRQQEKAQREVQFRDLVVKIEARADLTPLQKEQAVRQAAKMMGMADTISNLMAQQEARQRAERDNMLTVGGIAGVVGNAAINSPSVVMARADAQVKLGIPQAESRRAIDQADAAMKTGKPQAQSREAMAALGGAVPQHTLAEVQAAAGDTTEQKEKIQDAMQASIDQHQGEMADAKATIAAAKPKNAYSVTGLSDLAGQDKGRKVYVEFIGGKKLTEHLQQAFKDNGYNVVASAAEAEAVYQFDGEYDVLPSASHEGLAQPVGTLSDDTKLITPPKEKSTLSSLKGTVGSFFVSMAGAPLKKQSANGYSQAVLVVANRRLNGQDSRVSALSSGESETLEPSKLIDSAMVDLMKAVGIHEVDAKPASAADNLGLTVNISATLK